MDSDFLEIGASVSNQSATFFVGTGFSKHLTDQSAPSWEELLYQCALKLSESEEMVEDLFGEDQNGTTISNYPLPVIADIFEIEFNKEGQKICEVIKDIGT